jgi:hypothetical protein
MGRVPHTLSVLPDIPDIRTVIGVIAVVAVMCIVFVGLNGMDKWYGFVDKGIMTSAVAICVGIDVDNLQRELDRQSARREIEAEIDYHKNITINGRRVRACNHRGRYRGNGRRAGRRSRAKPPSAPPPAHDLRSSISASSF